MKRPRLARSGVNDRPIAVAADQDCFREFRKDNFSRSVSGGIVEKDGLDLETAPLGYQCPHRPQRLLSPVVADEEDGDAPRLDLAGFIHGSSLNMS